MCTHMHSTHTHAYQQERISKWEAYRRVHTHALHVFLCVYTCRATIDSVENDEIGGTGARAHTHTHTLEPWKKAIHLDDAFLPQSGRLDHGISARWSL